MSARRPTGHESVPRSRDAVSASGGEHPWPCAPGGPRAGVTEELQMLSRVLPPALLAVTLLGPCSPDDSAFAARSRARTAPRLGAAPRICPAGRANNKGPLPLMGSLFIGCSRPCNGELWPMFPARFSLRTMGAQDPVDNQARIRRHGHSRCRRRRASRRLSGWRLPNASVDDVPTQALPLNARWQKASRLARSLISRRDHCARGGSYYLEARWRGGAWRGIFAAGRIVRELDAVVSCTGAPRHGSTGGPAGSHCRAPLLRGGQHTTCGTQ